MANYDDPNRRPRTTRAVDAETVIKEVDVLHETDKAWQCRLVQSRIVHWFPKSQCELYERNLSQYLSIPMWLAVEKKIEDDE